MARITSEIRASQWSVATERLIKDSSFQTLKTFILDNSEIEEDPDEMGRIHDGKKNLWGKTYLLTDKAFGNAEFFISEDGRIFFLISLNHQVEIIDDSTDDNTPEGMTLVKVDKNGSKHFEGQVTCPRCGGTGYYAIGMMNMQPVLSPHDYGVCWKCMGTKKVFGKLIVRTPEYQAKLDARRKAKEDKKKEESKNSWLEKHGWSSDGHIFLFLGKTYEKKEEIKSIGGRYNSIIGWYIDHKIDGFDLLQVSKEDVLVETPWGYDFRSDVDFETMKEAELTRLHPSESSFQGVVGSKLTDLHLTLTLSRVFECQNVKQGWNGRNFYKDTKRFFYSFKDSNNNILTWTASKDMNLSQGSEYIVTGTVKEHKVYKGQNQTVLTRCKVQGI